MAEPDVRVERLAPMRVAWVRAVGRSPEEDAWRRLSDWARPAGLLEDTDAHPVFGFNNPGPSPGDPEYGYELWIAVDADTQPPAGVGAGPVPAHRRPGGWRCRARRRKIAGRGAEVKQVRQEEPGTATPSFEPSRGRGPVGTGVHVLRRVPAPDGTTVADVWLTLLFVPVVPLGRWIVEPAGGSGSAWRVRQVGRPHPGRSLAWVAGGLLAALASLLPAVLAVTFLMGSKTAELAGLFSSAGAFLGALGWLDQTRDRVPFGTATRIVGARATSPGKGL